jgi:hypothetical protein
MRKGKDLDPDPYFLLTDPDPRGTKTPDPYPQHKKNVQYKISTKIIGV